MSFWLILTLCYNSLIFLVTHISYGDFFTELKDAALKSALVFTVWQALASGFFSVLLGAVAAPGYAALGRSRRMLRWVFLFPNMMSSVLVVLALLLVFSHFPFGFWGVIIGHIFLNGGLCAVWLGESYFDITERWHLVTTSLGARWWLTFTKVILPELWPQIKICFAVVTTLCLTSFAIPLVLGGGAQYSTLEVLLYERIHAYADVAGASAIGVIQCLLQGLVFLAVAKPILLKAEYRRAVLSQKTFTRWSLGWVTLTLALALVSLVPIAELAYVGSTSLSSLREAWLNYELPGAINYSLTIASLVSVIALATLIFIVSLGFSSKILLLPNLSGVVVGLGLALGFLSLGLRSPRVFIAAMVLGHLAVILMPILRLTAPSLISIRMKVQLPLKSLGASPLIGMKKVYLPLTLRIATAGGLMAGCWSMGEFSVASLLSRGPVTLPVYIQALVGSYRLEMASGCSIILLLLSVLAMTALEVLANGMV